MANSTGEQLIKLIYGLGDLVAQIIYFLAFAVGGCAAMGLSILPIFWGVGAIIGDPRMASSGREMWQLLGTGVVCLGILRIPYVVDRRQQ